MTFREQLEILEHDLSDKFTSLTEGNYFIFIRNEEVDNAEALQDNELYEMRNDITGNTFDVFIISVANGVFKVIEAEDLETIHTDVRFSDFSSVLDRVNIIESIETTEFSNLCICNNCSSIMLDQNPQINAPKFAIQKNEIEMQYISDGEDSHWACPACMTDDYLNDNIQ